MYVLSLNLAVPTAAPRYRPLSAAEAPKAVTAFAVAVYTSADPSVRKLISSRLSAGLACPLQRGLLAETKSLIGPTFDRPTAVLALTSLAHLNSRLHGVRTAGTLRIDAWEIARLFRTLQ